MGEPDPTTASSADDAELERAIAAFLTERGPELEGFEGLPPLGLEDAGAGAAGGTGGTLASFELVRRIGEGGMGIVFEARQRTALGRRVAVKLLRPFASEAGRERFRREIEAVLALDHPGIVPVVAAEVEGDAPFLAMKLVDGVSLTELLLRLREDGPLPADTRGLRAFVEGAAGRSGERTPPPATPTDLWREPYVEWAAQLALQLCEALQHAHDRGVVHRDVKPGNVVVTPEGRAILLDFGIAATEEAGTLTRTGDFVGTLHYSAPEQAAGRAVDGRADVYSVGATLHELLTLRRPHEDATPTELLRRGTELEPPPLGGAVPADLETICRCALAGERGRRYATPAAMAADLRAFLAGLPILARPPGWSERTRRALRRHPRAVALAVATLVLGAALGAWGRARWRAGATVRAAAPLVAGARELRAELRDEMGALARWIDDAEAVGRLDLSALPARLARLEERRAALEDRYGSAKRALEAAFVHVAGHAPALRALADLHAVRLHQALDELADVRDPERLAGIARDLAAVDLEGRHAALLDRRGRVTLATRPAGVRVRIFQGGGERAELAGETPLVLEDLAEGSYLAVAEHPAGGVSRLPFLVRRAAVYAREPRALPPRELELELLPESARRPGFVHVPAGWTLVGDDPPRWRWVAGFEIQRREVTFEEYLEWWNATRPEPADHYLPEGFAASNVRFEDGGGRREARSGIGDWPVFGLSPDAMARYSQRLEPPRAAVPGARYTDLPDPAEWIRAARGADGRRYPWGDVLDDWSCCAAYPSPGRPGSLPEPFPVETFPRDVSPFGVRDLAGSIAELLGEYRLGRHGESAVGGGSYESRRREDMRILGERTTKNVPADDLGMRLVRRPVPAWMTEPDRAPEPFHDDFERPDGDVVGNGWREYGADPLTALDPARAGDLCFLRDGRLVCAAEGDQFSAAGRVYRRVQLGDRFRVRVTLAYSAPRPDERRSVGIELGSAIGTGGQSFSLAAALSGGVWLNGPPGTDERSAPPFPLERPYVFEIEGSGGELSGRIWPADGERPAGAMVTLPAPDEPLRFLSVAGRNLVQGSVEVGEVAVEILE